VTSRRHFLNSGTTNGTRPKVLLVDDHVRILESVARELAADFNVVAMVTDGHQALTAADRLQPDLIVLDVAMPGLDGFQTLRQLKRNGTRAKVVLLTMYESDEYVAKALECDAHGYVVKTRIRQDLVNALNHALLDQFLVPQVSPLASADRNGHAVLFYAHEPAFHDAAARYLATALARGDSIAIALTEANRTGIARRLNAEGWDPLELEKQGRYLAVDSEEVLSQVMRHDAVNENSLADLAESLERHRLASSLGPQSRLTFCAAVAPLLCRDGKLEAAIQVERAWDALTRTRPFLTLCAYPLEYLNHDAPPELFEHICGAHSLVSHMADAA
jgi:DNA-binding NarL/FixJ family response regulator